MYTDLPEVAAYISAAWYVLIAFTIFDTTQAMGIGIIRASGKQYIGAILTGVAYMLIGIPISYVCGFIYDLDNTGLWVGPTVAVAFNTICYNIIIVCMDWEKLIKSIK